MSTHDNDGLSPNVSTKPYLIRAIHQWAVDNHLTPQVLVIASMPGVVVPMHYVKNDQIILNIHPQSVKGLELGDDFLWFSARFSGQSIEITLPIDAVVAVYSRENGQGIFFQGDGSGVNPPNGGKGQDKKPDGINEKPKEESRPPSPTLKLVK